MKKNENLKLMLTSFVLGLFWISFNNLPVLPVGFIITFFVMRKEIKFNWLISVIIASVISFVGTGIYFGIQKNNGIKISLDFNVGTSTIQRLASKNINENKINVRYSKKDQFLNDNQFYINEFFDSYNSNGEFIINNFYLSDENVEQIRNLIVYFRDNLGKINEFNLVGYNVNSDGIDGKRYIIYYKVEFEKNKDFKYFQITLLNINSKIEISEIYVLMENTEIISK